MFEGLDAEGYETYLNRNPFHLELGIDLEKYIKEFSKQTDIYRASRSTLQRKKEKGTWESVDPNNREPFPAELDDLIRLHYLVTSRKVTTILEFGVGKSSIVFDHALSQNKLKHESFVRSKLRRSNVFECHSIDNSQEWINAIRNEYPFKNVFFHQTECRMATFNDRICSFYDQLPNVSPDFIYLDAPDQFSVKDDVRGISTRSPDRLPMAADILAIEHFLLPGTLVVVDGRTANARFIKANLQREWSYMHSQIYDQHYFELIEEPLGRFNAMQIEFSRSK